MNYIFLFLFTIIILSCENHSFDSDKRQLIAKDEIRGKLSGVQSFDITDFKEDTLNDWTDTTFKNHIRYSLNIVYKDSAGGHCKTKKPLWYLHQMEVLLSAPR